MIKYGLEVHLTHRKCSHSWCYVFMVHSNFPTIKLLIHPLQLLHIPGVKKTAWRDLKVCWFPKQFGHCVTCRDCVCCRGMEVELSFTNSERESQCAVIPPALSKVSTISMNPALDAASKAVNPSDDRSFTSAGRAQIPVIQESVKETMGIQS